MSVQRRAWHPKLGWGVVRGVRSDGVRTTLDVDFSYVRGMYPSHEFLEEPGGKPLVTDELPVEPRRSQDGATHSGVTSVQGVAPQGALTHGEPKPDTSWVDARRAVFALRLGQVPDSIIHNFTVGTSELEAGLREAISRTVQRRRSFVIIEGPWGSGKSHALSLLQSIAGRERLVTSAVILDGVGSSLCAPMELLEGVAATTRFPDGSLEGLGERLADVLRSDQATRVRASGAATLADALDRIPPPLADDADAWHLVEDYVAGVASASQATRELSRSFGRAVRLPPMKARALVDRPGRCAQLLAEWARASTVMGAKGLVVVLDEADVEYALGGRTQRELDQRVSLIQALRELSSTSTPLLVAIAAAPSAVREFDAVADLEEMFGHEALRLRVPELTRAALAELAQKVCELHAQAYRQLPAEGCRSAESCSEHALALHQSDPAAVPRRFIRLLLELLDTRCSSVDVTSQGQPELAG